LHYCIEQKVIPFCLPPNSTNILQPLDIAVFSPYKNYYSQILELEFHYDRFGVTKETLWPFLPEAQAKAFTEGTIKYAFACTAIWPLDQAKVLKIIPAYDLTHYSEPWENLSFSTTSSFTLSTELPAVISPSHSPTCQRTHEQEHCEYPPSTPKTPLSLQTLGEATLASITCSSPSSLLQR